MSNFFFLKPVFYILFIAFVSLCHLSAQNSELSVSDFRYTIENDVQISSKILEFDLFLFDADASQPFELSTVQAGILVNPAIYNGGTLTASIIAGTSQLNLSQQPSSITFTQTANCIKLAAKAPPGAGSGTIISSVSPGSRICRIRLTNSQNFGQSQANLTFNFTVTPYPTKVAQYINGTNTAMQVTSSNTFSNALNALLNPTTLPLAFQVIGGGSYCQGSTIGVPVGLDGSEAGILYTLFKDGTAQVPTVTGTGNEISFGNQLGGNYTVSGSNNLGTTPMSGTASVTISTGEPVITSVFIVPDLNPVAIGNPVTLSARPTNGGTPGYQWFVNNNPAGSNNDHFTYIPSQGDLVHLIMTSSLPVCLAENPVTSNTIEICTYDNSMSGIVAYYPFNGNANDESGKGNNGIIHGAILTADRVGTPNSAFEFDGIDDYIDCGNNPSVNIYGECASVSISCWFYPHNPGWQYLISKGRDYTDNYGYHIHMNFEDKLRAIYRLSNDVDCAPQTSIPITPNQWYHVISTYNGSVGKLYINGSLVDSVFQPGQIGGTYTNLVIGCHSPDPPSWYPFDGVIDDIRIFNRELNQDEINSISSEGTIDVTLQMYPEGLYNLNLGYLNSAKDETGNPKYANGIADKVSVKLAQSKYPYQVMRTFNGLDMDTNGVVKLSAIINKDSTYYVIVDHRNSIDTWSSVPLCFDNDSLKFSFTNNQSKAFDSNLKNTSGNFCLFGGDVTKEGLVDATDMVEIDNHASNFSTGYLPQDANGDGLIDASDMIIVENNSRNFVAIQQPVYHECNLLKVSNHYYHETDNLINKIHNELGSNYTIADWNDIKGISDIQQWINCMGLTEDMCFMVTRNGGYYFNGYRQYYVQYSSDGIPYPGFQVHDQINNKIFLGSWYGLTMNVLGLNRGIVQCNNLRITSGRYNEGDDLNSAVKGEYGKSYLIADWIDLQGITNLNDWISCMGLTEDECFMVTFNGQYVFNGTRQYYVQYSSDGVPFPGFLVHAQIGNLYLGSWYGLDMNILGKTP